MNNDQNPSTKRTLCLWVYILYLLGGAGVFGLLLALAARGSEGMPRYVASHLQFQVRLGVRFLLYGGLATLGLLLALALYLFVLLRYIEGGVGILFFWVPYLPFLVLLIWFYYQTICGLKDFLNGKEPRFATPSRTQ